MARHRRSRFITQAQQDAIVRFGPEISGLKALIAEAQSEKRSGILAARSTARSVTSAINQATPGVAQVYREAAGTQKAAAARVQADIAGLQGLNPNVRGGYRCGARERRGPHVGVAGGGVDGPGDAEGGGATRPAVRCPARPV
jgi:hypothetical protein